MRLRLIAKRSPSVPHLQLRLLLSSNKFSSLFRLRRMVSWAAPNGGEGGIRTPGTFRVQLISSQSHSATLPLLLKVGQESRLGGLWQASTIGQSLTILLKSSAGMNKADRATYNKIKIAR